MEHPQLCAGETENIRAESVVVHVASVAGVEKKNAAQFPGRRPLDQKPDPPVNRAVRIGDHLPIQSLVDRDVALGLV